MGKIEVPVRHRRTIGIAVATTALIAMTGSSSAEVGHGFVQIPGISGNARADGFKNWIRVEGRYWGLNSIATLKASGVGSRAVFTTPAGPSSGGGDLIIAVDKASPALKQLMATCDKKATIPELTFAESSDDFRAQAFEVGERPDTVPAFYKYKLKDVKITTCAVDPKAPEQGLVLNFSGIEWLNYDKDNPRIAKMPVDARMSMMGGRPAEAIKLQPAVLPAAQTSGKVRTFVVNWFGYAHDVNSDQCPTMNTKPPAPGPAIDQGQAASDIRAAMSQMAKQERRAAGALNACLIPGVAPAAENFEPQTKIARGLNLDGDDGTGKGTARSCKHANYASPTGEAGIDNQFYRVAGCILGLQGVKGLWQQVVNEEMHSGALSMLVQISGIDDERNDDNIDVTILYSEDDPAKDVGGKEVLADYTFRLSDKPEFTHFFRRLHGRIVNGVIETDQVKSLDVNLNIGPAIRMADARMKLQFTPEGNLKGVLGGYQDWHYLHNYFGYTGFEVTFNFQCPAIYGALKRAADGMKDPVTGECNGISTAYDIEAFPALIPRSQQKALFASAQTTGK